MKPFATTAYRVQLFVVTAALLAFASLGSSTAWAQTPPTPTHTFQPAGSSGAFGTNTNWSADTLPVAGSQVLIADGKTATMTQTEANTLFGSLTLGTNSIISLAASLKQGPAAGSVIYFNNGSQLNYTSGDTNRAATYNIVSGATAQMQLSGTTAGDSLPQGSLVGDSTTTVNYRVVNLTNLRWNANSFNGTINYQSNDGTSARVVALTNFNEGGNKTGPGTTNFASLVRGTMGTSNDMNDSGTLQLTGSSGGASNVKFDMGGNTDTIGGLTIDTPTGATATAPTLRGSTTNALTVSGATTFQGTAGNVNFDSSNASPSTTTLLTTGNMTFGGTGTWAVSGDGRINLNAGSGTRTITTNTNASIANTLIGSQGFTKAGTSSLTLTGANTYTGATNVNAGTLVVNGSLAAGSTVAVGLSGMLGGNGTISGATTINGFHAPGNSPGIQTFGGGLTYNGTSTLTWELIDNTAAALDRGVDYDGVNVTGGAFSLVTGAEIDLAFGGTVDFLDTFWSTDQEWLVVDLSGGATASDTNLFTIGSITGGANYSPSLGSFGIERKAGSNAADSVYLTWVAVPEPSALALAGLGMAGVAYAVRSRRKA
jgi:autotransporter-associated beta strand protein